LISAEEGKTEAATEAFSAALAATHSDDHEFMTRVQALWTYLIDNRRYMAALACLNEVYPRVTREHLDEIGELLTETLLAAVDGKGKSSIARVGNRRPGRRGRVAVSVSHGEDASG
jgi:hypothetical protein